MKTSHTRTVIWIVIFILLFGSYKSYFVQREKYASNIASHLELACRQCIMNDFGPFVSIVNLSKDRPNWIFKRESEFSIYNDFRKLSVEVTSIVYFPNLAPQEITCIAYLPYDGTTLSESTQIAFRLFAPVYFPNNYGGYWFNRGSFQLTLKDIEEISPLSELFPLKKPKYNLFNYYLKLLSIKSDVDI